jgi:hypothetical protein
VIVVNDASAECTREFLKIFRAPWYAVYFTPLSGHVATMVLEPNFIAGVLVGFNRPLTAVISTQIQLTK